ncbi:MAG: ABC transporter substrate-binding protein [Xanthobacteraceae bacterium]
MRTLSLAWAVVCVVVSALALVGPAQADPLKIRGAWVAPVSNWASIWLAKKDLAKHFGQSYVFEPTHFAGTPPMVTAIANNEAEIGDLAFSTLPIAISNAGLDDIRILADEFQDGAPGYRDDTYEVLADGPIKKIEDLKGKVVATNAIGSGVDVAMRAMLRKHGLEANRDYTIVEAPFPAMAAMLTEKKVALIPAILPFALGPQYKVARPLFTVHDAIGVSQFVVWTARKPFIDAHRAALVDFMEDSMRIERWYLDPKNHDAAAAIASKMTKQPAERFGWLFTKQDYYRNPDMKPNLDALQQNVNMTKALGFVQSSFDVKTHSDLSLVEDAAKRLK